MAVVTVGDITERKRQDHVLHEERERLAAALEANQRLVEELREALASVKTLSGLLPVCAWCHKIRDEHSDAQFTHGMCPSCLERECPDHE